MSHFDKIQINGKEHFPLFMELKTMVSVLFNFKRSLWIITFIVQSRMTWLCKHNRHSTNDLHHTTNLWATKQSTITPNDHTKAYSISLSIEKKMKKFHLLHKILILIKRVRDNFATTNMMSYLTPFLICCLL